MENEQDNRSVETAIDEKPNRRGAPLGNQRRVSHGLYRYKKMLKGDALDKRTSLSRAMVQAEQELVEALGGDPTPQERIVIADTVKHLLFMSSLDRYLMNLKSLVRRGKVHAVLPERTRIGAHVRENLKTLGLERKAKPTLDLAQRLALAAAKDNAK